MTLDWRIFTNISQNVCTEERDAAPITTCDMDDCPYTLETFAERMETAAAMLCKADRHESLGPLYRLITPVYEMQCDYSVTNFSRLKVYLI